MTPSPRAFGAALAAAAAVFAGDARAATHRVAVIDADQALVHALDVALSPWGVEVDEHAVVAPGATMPMATDRARALASDARADAVVWLSSSDGGYALWVYDAESDHASARRLPAAPPFDDTTAAAIALSVKTVLRATTLAPPRERFGASFASEDTTWRFDVDVGGAVRTGDPRVVEPRGGVGGGYWPARYAYRVGLLVGVEGGTGIHVHGDRFTASVLDVSLRLALAASVRIAPAIALVPSLGAAAHAVFIDGFVATSGAPASLQRIDPAVEPRLLLDFATFAGRVHFGPWIGVAWMTRSQQVLVRGAEVFDFAPVVAHAALRVSLGIE